MNKTILILITVFVVGGIGAFLLLNSNRTSNELKSQNKSLETSRKIEGYQGNVLAGNVSPFLEFNKADYERAKSQGKIILLDFYANWCPVCRAEEPAIHSGFDELNDPNIVGFRVSFNDSDTDSDEKALAQEFNIPYQHTKVILKNGVEVSRSNEQWTKEDLIGAVNKELE
ncbi:MAG: hypothetical protein A3C30_04720 [Candidatus Levybacteria bacterium RIFCSPHIGHO2_02_FULL_40_18]|nr:MAG: hypothetical protein A2869_02375 [Candidatus Levybacteria bacterium RIFCSPHIGHO2_01_FULL_40_58]OGH26382.1 MAG: hypothetical protein A3C30_04720 [Candidatus Levybacteria bacterium RIFCSPHIGHO2_02_FULL_40_18]OGH31829.1 MAG: hypothetical protein A3E43_00515 [Candidatus Levybacteria bacterium RIFCSPHIGHO2_12_FULL_40_31]OGH40462.1 MAG: hypothetical protein A2894_01020 [Candidatus Levybacteria bacterium RIFCSPLOWO2_01_FULL_40_64]OGH49169.1 MAG: hypothetical protein A3I54_04420 [Candidatus Lev